MDNLVKNAMRISICTKWYQMDSPSYQVSSVPARQYAVSEYVRSHAGWKL